ncbi:hypothetical protein [Halorubrum ezzemoulense]|jgi:uncharacterized MnhB-related membrane protein|uniref:Uncharacterized protein n=1 Tax=Halorubrum ezzemoulense TaxID=337243 RepID=A0A481RLL8_HALEZ|nr:hypothetical protein [Halorubrum ezzemoulense]QAY21859.1 hypothetical protein EO776_18275 [Halorubrum ezzemoulense]
MNEVRRFDLENPWLFVFTNVVVGIVVVSATQVILFNGELTSAVIQGGLYGLVVGITMFYLRKDDWF